MKRNTIRSDIKVFWSLLFNIFLSNMFLMSETEFASPKNTKTPTALSITLMMVSYHLGKILIDSSSDLNITYLRST